MTAILPDAREVQYMTRTRTFTGPLSVDQVAEILKSLAGEKLIGNMELSIWRGVVNSLKFEEKTRVAAM